MSSFRCWKIESEIKDIKKFPTGEEFDFTDSWIIRLDREIYEEEFRSLLLEFGRPVNTQDDYLQFTYYFLHQKKGFDVEDIEFNWHENYTNAKTLQERLECKCRYCKKSTQSAGKNCGRT